MMRKWRWKKKGRVDYIRMVGHTVRTSWSSRLVGVGLLGWEESKRKFVHLLLLLGSLSPEYYLYKYKKRQAEKTRF